jgi:hypothetical protein
MGFIDSGSKSSRLLASRRYTHNTYTTAQESFTNVLDLREEEIYTQAQYIPSSGLPYSGSSQHGLIQQASGSNLMKYWYRHKLTPSNVNDEVWFFLNPTGSDSGIGAQLIDDNQQTSFISPKYSIASLANSTAEDATPGYGIVAYKSSTYTQSHQTGSLGSGDKISGNDYIFDYKTGVLQFLSSAHDPASNDVVFLTAYQYVGQTLKTGLDVRGPITASSFKGDVTGDITGNADTATALESGRTIGMTGDVVWTSPSFDGSGAVTAVATIQGTSVDNSMLAGSIADSKLSTISTANKVALTALDIDGGTDIGAAIVDADLIILDDAAGGTNRKATMSRLKTYMSGVSGGSTLGNIQVGVTGANELDTSGGNLTIDSAGGTTTIDDILSVAGAATFDSTLLSTGNLSTAGVISGSSGIIVGNIGGSHISGSTGNLKVTDSLLASKVSGSEFTGSSAIFDAATITTATIVGGTVTGITDITVADGGTGASTFTDGGILLGSGTSAVTAMAVLGDGEFIVGDGSTDPVAESGTTLRTSIGVGTGDSPTFTGLTLTGNLTVQGDTTTLSTTNLQIGDAFIFAATGSAASNVDGGLIVQSGSAVDSGSAIYHDTQDERWAVAKGVASDGTAVTPTAYVSTTTTANHSPNTTSGSYGEGEMWIDTTLDEIWVRTG